MLKLFYLILKDFGALGIGVIQLILIVWGGYRFFVDRLKRIQDTVTNNSFDINNVDSKITILNNDLKDVSERVATVEGRCSAFHTN